MSGIIFHYFPLRGRAEPINLLLKHQGLQYTKPIITYEQWREEIKTSGLAQFEALPVLEIDGHKLVQTIAICKYLANKFGYYSEDPYEAYLIDSLVMYTEDILLGVVPIIRRRDMEGAIKHLQDKGPQYLGNFQKRLTAVIDGDGFFLGERVTVADFFAFRIVYDLYYEGERKERSETIFDQYAPKLREWVQRMIDSSETFRAYVEAREPDPYAPQQIDLSIN